MRSTPETLTPEKQALKQRFLTMLSFRQIEIGALYLDGWTQEEIAKRLGLYQTTVSRDLRKLREACTRVGTTLPEPERIDSQNTIQISDRMRLLI